MIDFDKEELKIKVQEIVIKVKTRNFQKPISGIVIPRNPGPKQLAIHSDEKEELELFYAQLIDFLSKRVGKEELKVIKKRLVIPTAGLLDTWLEKVIIELNK